MPEASQYPFPGVVFTHKDQFDDYRTAHSAVLDHRYKLEQSLAATHGSVIVAGLCPLTRQPTEFKTPVNMEVKKADGAVDIDWRNYQICSRGLAMADRSLAHYALYNAPEGRLGQVYYASDNDGLINILQPYSGDVERGSLATLFDRQTSYDTILVVNGMERQADQVNALRAIYNRLGDGGQALFYINFHYFDVASVQHKAADMAYWAIGWDFLDQLKAAGFVEAHAVTFWAQDTGYLGPFNFVFYGLRA